MGRKYKLTTLNKSYSYRDSIFYLLKTKKKLAAALNTDLKCLKEQVINPSYNAFKNGERQIQAPISSLNDLHTRIASLLCRIKQPDYVHSGVKGKSHYTNAVAHRGSHKLLTMDLKGFFPSTTKRMVFNFFYKKMRCSPDVSELLAQISTYNGFLPTGSRLSMPLAYWANERMFNDLNGLACTESIKMTLFVDDITFSGSKINEKIIYKLEKIISSYDHASHPDKTKTYEANQPKLVTGVVLIGDETRVRNSNHQKIHQDMVQWAAIVNNEQVISLNRRLLGRLNSQSMIDQRFKGKARSVRLKSKT